MRRRAGDFELHQESLFLAVALLDRYLSATEVSSLAPRRCTDSQTNASVSRFWLPAQLPFTRSLYCLQPQLGRCERRVLCRSQGVARNDLQLISVACMLVAAKHEEVRGASVVASPLLSWFCRCVSPPSAQPLWLPRRHESTGGLNS